MGIIVRGVNPKPRPPEAPPTFRGNPPPPGPPPVPKGFKSWDAFWKSEDLFNRQNPMMSLTAAYILSHTRQDKDEDNTDYDDLKKKARVAAIKAANKAKRKSWNSNVSGTGTVTPILSSYPSGIADQAGAGFSMSDIPSIVWIVLAVSGGIFLIKSAGKGKRR
jgi:hypothetical protein